MGNLIHITSSKFINAFIVIMLITTFNCLSYFHLYFNLFYGLFLFRIHYVTRKKYSLALKEKVVLLIAYKDAKPTCTCVFNVITSTTKSCYV